MNEKPLLKFKIPELQEVEGYAVRLPDGTITVRAKHELKAIKKEVKEGESGTKTGG